MSGLVRVRENGFEHNTGAARAEAKGLTVLDEPTHRPDGSPRPATRAKGRPIKPRKSVDQAAAEKKSADESAGHQPSHQAAVIESAPTIEENHR